DGDEAQAGRNPRRAPPRTIAEPTKDNIADACRDRSAKRDQCKQLNTRGTRQADHAQRQKNGEERNIGNGATGPCQCEQQHEAPKLERPAGRPLHRCALSDAGPVDSRDTSAAGTTTGCSGKDSPRWAAMISSTERDAVAAIGWSTAVSGGSVKRTMGVLSKLISDRSAGTSSASSRATSRQASVIWSLLAMIAVAGLGIASNVRAAIAPER